MNRDMPKYKCHKVVQAIKIDAIENIASRGWVVLLAENRVCRPIVVSIAYLDATDVEVGGYYVRYEDGFESYSPAEVFEKGYTLIDQESSNE